jgi:hypothetical protein
MELVITPPPAPDSGLNTPEYANMTPATRGSPRYNDWALFSQCGYCLVGQTATETLGTEGWRCEMTL